MPTLTSPLARPAAAPLREPLVHPWLLIAGAGAVAAAVTQVAVRVRRARRRLPERRDAIRRGNLSSRIAAEFAEMPGMTLTLSQASRFLGLPSAMCERVLSALVVVGALRRTVDGRYVRAEPQHA